jgi:hypothetical protein
MNITTSRFPAALDLGADGDIGTSKETHMGVQSTGHQIRPRTVSIAAILHFAIALAFLSIPLLGLVYGGEVQAAAAAEVARQGQSPDVLAANGLSFDEAGSALWAPAAIAALVAAIGVIALLGRRIGRLLSWIVLPVVLAGNFLIIASNAAVTQAVQGLLDDSGDAALQSLDAQALVDAAYSAYPDWLPALLGFRFAVVTLGCVLAVVLLALRPARVYFRKA